MRSKATAVTMKDALCRILPVPCKEHYTAVALIPRASRWQQLLTKLVITEQDLSAESKVILKQSCLLIFSDVLS